MGRGENIEFGDGVSGDLEILLPADFGENDDLIFFGLPEIMDLTLVPAVIPLPIPVDETSADLVKVDLVAELTRREE